MQKKALVMNEFSGGFLQQGVHPKPQAFRSWQPSLRIAIRKSLRNSFFKDDPAA